LERKEKGNKARIRTKAGRQTAAGRNSTPHLTHARSAESVGR
jgi:hypothetical protein